MRIWTTFKNKPVILAPVFTGVNYDGDLPVASQWIPAFAGMTLLYRT